MLLAPERITEFQALYKKHFGKEISRDAALEQGAKLIRLVELTYRPTTKDEHR